MKNQKLEIINQYLESSDDLTEFIYNLIQMKNGRTSKNDLLKLAGYTDEQTRKVDSAYPSDYAQRIREIYPNFNNGNHCYDYNRMTFGEMTNINDLIIKHFHSINT